MFQLRKQRKIKESDAYSYMFLINYFSLWLGCFSSTERCMNFVTLNRIYVYVIYTTLKIIVDNS